VTLQERHIWSEAPCRDELAQIAAALPGGVRSLLSTRSTRYRELKLDWDRLSDEQLLDLLAKEPKLLRRPIIWDGVHAVVGAKRPEVEAFISHQGRPGAR
jgi:Spx/MgsR family transcriptional regulator